MKKSLLQIAQETKAEKHFKTSTPEEVELVVALANGEISYRQAATAMKLKMPGMVAQRSIGILGYGVRAGLIKISFIK